MILGSATYQQSSKFESKKAATDIGNKLLWRFPSRRLEAEAIRDLFRVSKARFFAGRESPPFNLQAFCPPDKGAQMSLF